MELSHDTPVENYTSIVKLLETQLVTKRFDLDLHQYNITEFENELKRFLVTHEFATEESRETYVIYTESYIRHHADPDNIADKTIFEEAEKKIIEILDSSYLINKLNDSRKCFQIIKNSITKLEATHSEYTDILSKL